MWSYSSNIDIAGLKSETKPVLIIKHSNRCSISSVAFNRLLENQEEIDLKAHVLLIDVVANRNISLQVADQLSVEHESPQVIILKLGKVVYTASHMGIRPSTLLTYL